MCVLGNPVHPGEVLEMDFLDELCVSADQLAQAIKVPPECVAGLIAKERCMTADMAMRLAKFWGTTPEFWMNLQRGFDLATVRSDTDRMKQIEGILPLA